jgi:hypothetical protein
LFWPVLKKNRRFAVWHYLNRTPPNVWQLLYLIYLLLCHIVNFL